jgi:hypothetical protein
MKPDLIDKIAWGAMTASACAAVSFVAWREILT